MQCKWLYSTFPLYIHHLGSLLDPRIKGSFLVSYGSDEKPVLKPRKTSFHRIIQQFVRIYIFFSSSLNYSIDKFVIFLGKDREETGGTKANERERAKHKLQSGANILDRCYQRFYNRDHHQGLLARF